MKYKIRNVTIILLLLIVSFAFSFLFNSLVIHNDFQPESYSTKVTPKTNSIDLIIPKLGGTEDCLLKFKFNGVNCEVRSLRFNSILITDVESKLKGVILTSMCFIPRKVFKESGNRLEIILRGDEPKDVDIWVTNYRKDILQDIYVLKISGKTNIFQEISVLKETILWMIFLIIIWNAIYFLLSGTGFFKKRMINLLIIVSLGIFLSLLLLIYLSYIFTGFMIKISFQYFIYLLLIAFLPVLLGLIYSYCFSSYNSLRKFIKEYLRNSKGFFEPSDKFSESDSNKTVFLIEVFLDWVVKIFHFFFVFSAEILTVLFMLMMFLTCIFLVLHIKEAGVFFTDIAYFVILIAVLVKILFILFNFRRK